MILRAASDLVAISAALAVSFVLRFVLGWFEVTEAAAPTPSFHIVASAMWLVGLFAAIAINRLYDEDTLFPGGGEIARVFRAVFEAGAILSGFVFITQSFYVSRSWFALVLVFSAGFLSCGRLAIRRNLAIQRRRGKRRRPAILVGSVGEWEDWPFENEHEFEVVDRVTLAGFEELHSSIGSERRTRLPGAAVVLKARDFTRDEFWRILMLAGTARWSVFVHSPVRSVGRDRLTLREVAGQAIVKVAPPTLTGARAVEKRVLDIGMAVVLLVILAPLFLILGCVILVTSGRPILYRQTRVGLEGRTFEILKFRTLPEHAEEGTGPVWATAEDTRPTPSGKWLRRSSLDELPQLWNVLKGDMSLVGPRPERPSFAEDFSRDLTWYRFRNRIRPGITGWAQSHGLRGNTSIDSRVQFDNWYIENWSVWLDLKILALTARELVTGRNAY